MNPTEPLTLSSFVAGQTISTGRHLQIRSPYDNRLAGTVELAGRDHTEAAI